MPRNFYKNIEYRERQSAIMKENWKKGLFDSVRKREKRICKCCRKFFEATPSDPKIYCNHSCAAKDSNLGRIQSDETKIKIGKASMGRKSPYKGILKVPRVEIICANPKCRKKFVAIEWANRKYCSNKCHMAVTGGKPTSPKASRGKAGIRKDISNSIYFYSRWEANYARLQNYLGVEWKYEPKTFDLGSQSYTPDFYLPKFNKYIEVKNFLWKYSKIRDEKFRKLYPNIKLQLLLKEDYLKLENKYSHLIKNWEYKNSRFNVV
ncbi:MAG: hypothetical protein A2402_00220 [Candidatus Staskawiczbacteria bacterium RIFOXYC1_FULL_37_43]|nr:MAG: hypothetical protein A2813_01070 [Candidatus Staskawiczbacteria bacterium RIFCSPHIGHO2_01_FULL_37_17]OGZ71848.1 MAG: hypothetical protein A2891_01635 [Candidatus Staskawiczbacteria bacterium RIFCSPLOWO2_01_FULL_37_19]OGZ76055.1 MAG: hypothetical protein A2205_03285 [Candidatus Staskawiczbacteria bacterium RIFOXYA1_FULL_37_15]OGZ76953.1 MAG: hypothetical protein A2280_01400 [Candidatus Staskawiczbacteria bacterium RIFOXYA12_FULL_37_10]OGZ80022.1 MAG: hypothetical protein A2353_02010 [Can